MTVAKVIDPFLKNISDVQTRLFVYVSSIIVMWVLIYTASGLFIDAKPASLIALLAGDILIVVATWLSVHFKNTQLGGIFITILIGGILFPINFYISGGPFGGTLVSFIATLLFIDIALTGRTKWVLFTLSFVMTAACCYVSLFRPEILPAHSFRHLVVTNTIALIMMGFLLNTIVLSGTHAYMEENEKANKQAEEIAKLNAAQSRFFSSMSHEIRTPVNTIIGLNESILRESDSQEILENAENIEAAGKMLLQTINDLLDMSRFEAGQMQLSPAAYRTGDMLSEVVGMLWMRAKEKDLEFNVDVAPDLPEELYGDEMRIRQILVNMLTNAIKYTDEGSVTLQIQCQRISEDRANVIYSVSDTGTGIKRENIPYLFTAFRRVDEEKNRYIEGSGLGLSIAKNLVDLMGGTISVNSIYTKGSTFIAEIPQTIVTDRPVGEIDPGRRHTAGKRKAYHQSFEAPEAKVLAVDDTVGNLMVIRKLLRDTKVQLTTAGSGAEALAKTQDTAFDVIFMDHFMPNMDGIECLHEIRNQSGGLSKEAKVIALTANTGSDLKAMYAREGFDGYLVKPVSGRDLERELQYALPRELVHISDKDDRIAEESIAWISDHQKKQPVAVTTESVADLPDAFLRKYGIGVIPHMISTKDGVFRDGIEVDTRGLLAYMEDGESISVREPDAAEYEAFFADSLQRANSVIHVSITSRASHSGCNTAMEAAKSFGNISVVDSEQLSSGQGLLALEAGRLAAAGKSVAEILEALEEAKKRVSTSFIVDSAEYLTHDNHISPAIATITGALLIHPVITVKKGKLAVKGICFGSREKVWEQYVNSTFRLPSTIDRRLLFITHAGLSQKELEKIRRMVEQKIQFENVYYQEASPSIAANCGPGTFGLLFMKR